ncbi:signal peptide protein [Skermanella stibiiresistens SB22]|uniref:Signal peptide protein n=1 Tax=Skermanella stibiiresistens SB22 TaxID=1385369 RepID=W9GX92_9PROT|nr:DUF1223 domain-containing protein [Skermanella stibiiresistens]EWY38424.1 signal peptide protein [Skermanella stibiiresistens SB22]
MLGIAAIALPMGFLFSSVFADQPTVVELFTSEGCPASPAADALLSELAGRPDVLALSYHVKWWDGRGWNDPFASVGATRRQSDYNDALGRASVYTPQMIIDGASEVFGGHARAVGKAVAERRVEASKRLGVGLRERDGGLDITVPKGKPALVERNARVLMVRYDLNRGITVKAGENRGRRLNHSHVVREITDLGPWTGNAQTLRAPAARAGQGVAVLIQRFDAEGRPAEILGAARLERRLLGASLNPWEAVARMARHIRANRDGGAGGATPL